MKLNVCRVPGGNFGDDLNDILWPTLFPDILNKVDHARVFGIGSILGGNHGLDSPKIVLGSGLGYKKSSPLDASWDIRWVRGKISAQTLGINEDFALGDGALLWSELRRTEMLDTQVGFIPHHASWESFDWDTIAREAGLMAINPKNSPNEVRRQLLRCRSVLAESLHGAIFADCLRIPWQAVALSYRFNRFKWKDWLSVTDIKFRYTTMPFPLVCEVRRSTGLKGRITKMLRPDDDARLNSLRPFHSAKASECNAVIDCLGHTAKSEDNLCLTNSQSLALLQDRMQTACRRFAKDYGLSCTL